MGCLVEHGNEPLPFYWQGRRYLIAYWYLPEDRRGNKMAQCFVCGAVAEASHIAFGNYNKGGVGYQPESMLFCATCKQGFPFAFEFCRTLGQAGIMRWAMTPEEQQTRGWLVSDNMPLARKMLAQARNCQQVYKDVRASVSLAEQEDMRVELQLYHAEKASWQGGHAQAAALEQTYIDRFGAPPAPPPGNVAPPPSDWSAGAAVSSSSVGWDTPVEATPQFTEVGAPPPTPPDTPRTQQKLADPPPPPPVSPKAGTPPGGLGGAVQTGAEANVSL